jgi:catechol 2,3-dioxygenase-like lactoylglutathione lyase family enzyme
MNSIVHIDFIVSSIEKSLGFYVGKLGFQVVDDSIVEGDLAKFLSGNTYNKFRMVFLRIAQFGPMIELIEFLESGDDDSPIPPLSRSPSVNISILVESISNLLQRMEENDLFPVGDLYNVSLAKLGNADIVFFRDPDGYLIEFVEMQ